MADERREKSGCNGDGWKTKEGRERWWNDDADEEGRKEGRKGLLKINLGCGNDLKQGYINIDLIDSADMQLDLEQAHIPLPDGSVQEILAEQVMEHITNFIPLMNECYRVLADGGKLIIEVPHIPYAEAFQDPTHVRFFTDASFDYFHDENWLHREVGKSYGIKPFQTLVLSKREWILRAVLQKGVII